MEISIKEARKMKIRKILPLLLIATCLAGCGDGEDAKFLTALNVPNNLAVYDNSLADHNLKVAASEIANIKSVYCKQTMEVYDADVIESEQKGMKIERNAYIKYFDNNIVKTNESYLFKTKSDISILSNNTSKYYYLEKEEGSDLYSLKNREVNENNNYASTSTLNLYESASEEYLLKNYMFNKLMDSYVDDFSSIFTDSDNMLGNESMMYKIKRSTTFDKVDNIRFPYLNSNSTSKDNYVPLKVDNDVIIKYKKDNGIWRFISSALVSNIYQLEDCYGKALEEPILVGTEKSISVVYYESNGGTTIPEETFTDNLTVSLMSFTDDSYLDNQGLDNLTIQYREQAKNENEFYFQRMVTLNSEYNYAFSLSNKTEKFGYNDIAKDENFDLYFASSSSSVCPEAFKVNYSGDYLLTVCYNYANGNLVINVEKVF